MNDMMIFFTSFLDYTLDFITQPPISYCFGCVVGCFVLAFVSKLFNLGK